MSDILIQLYIRKDNRDEASSMRDREEDITKEELKKELKMQINHINKVEGQVIGLLYCDNAESLHQK